LQKHHDSKIITDLSAMKFLNGFYKDLLPKIITLLGFLTLITSLVSSSFFADDFTNMVKYNRNFGSVSESDGKLVINVFWFLGTTFFGTASPLPFLLMNIAVFVFSFILLHQAFVLSRWNTGGVYWILSIVFSLGVIFPILLWSSNIVHTVALFCLCLNIFIQQRFLSESDLISFKDVVRQAFLVGIVWMICTLTNPLYIGLMALGTYFGFEQHRKFENSKKFRMNKSLIQILSLNVAPALIGFLLVAYPRVTAQSAYDISGTKFISGNIRFYLETINSNRIFPFILPLIAFALLLTIVIELKNSNFLPAALFLATVLIIYPILIQGQQRAVHYFSIPVILIVLSFLSSINRRDGISLNFFIKLLSRMFIIMIVSALVMGGSSIRSWFVSTPYGSSLEKTRSSIAEVLLDGEKLCVILQMDSAEQNRFIASMGGSNGFLVPPINASEVEFGEDNVCANQEAKQLVILSDSRGDFKIDSSGFGVNSDSGK
jgi:hypothetical protein